MNDDNDEMPANVLDAVARLNDAAKLALEAARRLADRAEECAARRAATSASEA